MILFSFFYPISCLSNLTSHYLTSLPSSSPPSLSPLITECEGIDNRLLPYVAPWLMFSGLSRCFSFIAHVMAHKLIPKRDLPDDFHSKKKEGKRKRDTHRERYWCLSLVKGTRRAAVSSTVGKSKQEQGEEKVPCALALIEIFSSILPGGASVSVMPNGVIKGINLGEGLICSAHHGIFIRYHHSVMNLLITSDTYCVMWRQGLPTRRTPWNCPVTSLSLEV